METEPYHYCLSDAMFYFYHIAHMAKHLEEGGCGIRTFLDLWIIDRLPESDRKGRDTLLSRGGLLTFAEAARHLSEVWFFGAEGNALSRGLERFVLGGGAFGSVEHSVAVKQTKKGGKLGYAIARIFPPYEKMKFRYPVLERKKWLLPVYHAVRWLSILHKGNGLQSLQELETNASMSENVVKSTAELMMQLGL